MSVEYTVSGMCSSMWHRQKVAMNIQVTASVEEIVETIQFVKLFLFHYILAE